MTYNVFSGTLNPTQSVNAHDFAGKGVLSGNTTLKCCVVDRIGKRLALCATVKTMSAIMRLFKPYEKYTLCSKKRYTTKLIADS